MYKRQTVGAPGDTASAAGLKNGDIITSINGTPIGSGTELEQYFAANPLDGSEIKVGYTHNGSQKETVFAPVERTVTELGFEEMCIRDSVRAMPLTGPRQIRLECLLPS